MKDTIAPATMINETSPPLNWLRRSLFNVETVPMMALSVIVASAAKCWSQSGVKKI
ncbi:hypothetical protein SCLCIDRAFT_1217970 [Scleroderma citrinum Foug A]|uniref:Uncharacterized protein n=1 Tax=Scleroderma citrinum Foug A TaxID=1036808 RepID=A0A0C3DTB8_9AGAM|nr:hypothetical protein SCLCIDRAFT_1217970 [Scleroderma citrinum Foug A]